MEFPEAKRVIYASNPLTEVVFQVRFPRIFAVDESLPTEFQASLGAGYPFIETKDVFQLEPTSSAPSMGPKRASFDFMTEDKLTTIHLTSEFLAVSTRDYKRWEHFKEHISAAMSALEAAYPISIFTRVGLRYVDRIERKKLGLTGSNWKELVREGALGLISDDEVSINDVIETQSAIVLQMPNDAKAIIRTGFERLQTSSEEIIFVVDSDFFVENSVKGTNDALDQCSTFKRYAGNAFRWFITDTLHHALTPTDP